MEERIGSVIILVEDRSQVPLLNQVISKYADCILGRQGLQLKDRGKSIISLVLEGTTDELGGLTGQLGRIKGIQVKSVLLKSS